MNYAQLFGGGSATLGSTLATNFFQSRTWTAPQDGIVIVRAMGAGGGGAKGPVSTGGYSGSWGCKTVRVKKGATIGVVIGAGGSGRTLSVGNGIAGGDTIITINGVQYIAYGGPGGVAGATGPLPDGPSPSANWDFGANSVKPGWVDSGVTGGAGVDILAQGNNATTSASFNYSGGGGTGAPGISYFGGGAMPESKTALGDTTAPQSFDASHGEWGISFYGGNGSAGSAGIRGGNGGGGGGNAGSTGAGGGHGGGGGASGTTNGQGGSGGFGGGGGATVVSTSMTSGGHGGQGFAHLKFYTDMGV